MSQFQKILVSVDTRFSEHAGLDWAVAIAERVGAEIQIVDIVPERWDAMATEESHELLSGIKDEALSNLVAELGKRGIQATHQVLSGRSSFEIIREVLRSKQDLVVRTSKGAHSKRLGFFGTTATRLLRKCPCPVLLVRPDSSVSFEKVLAAIGPTADPEHAQLGGKIMELATSFAGFADARCSVVQAWELFAASLLASRMPEAELIELEDMTHARAAEDLGRFLAEYSRSVNDKDVHLVRGDSAWVIAGLAKSMSPDLIVMGTLARTGVQGMMIGNSAERILERVQCSVLAIKREGFVSPVRAEGE